MERDVNDLPLFSDRPAGGWRCKCLIAYCQSADDPGNLFIPGDKINDKSVSKCDDCGTWRSEGVPA